MNINTFLDRLEKNERIEVIKCIEDVLKFSEESDNKRFFATCGLYAVGSSVSNEKHNDVDIALVGLDFGAVFEYDDNFLEPAEEIQKEKTGYYVHIEPSRLVVNLSKYLEANIHRTNIEEKYTDTSPERMINPLKPYVCECNKFLTSRFIIGKIDFNVHAENLFTKYWKEHQKKIGLQYVILHEWERANSINIMERPSYNQGKVPDFIDYNGRKRAERFQWEPEYFPVKSSTHSLRASKAAIA